MLDKIVTYCCGRMTQAERQAEQCRHSHTLLWALLSAAKFASLSFSSAASADSLSLLAASWPSSAFNFCARDLASCAKPEALFASSCLSACSCGSTVISRAVSPVAVAVQYTLCYVWLTHMMSCVAVQYTLCYVWLSRACNLVALEIHSES